MTATLDPRIPGTFTAPDYFERELAVEVLDAVVPGEAVDFVGAVSAPFRSR